MFNKFPVNTWSGSILPLKSKLVAVSNNFFSFYLDCTRTYLYIVRTYSCICETACMKQITHFVLATLILLSYL